MFIKLTNAVKEHDGKQIVINTRYIVSIFSGEENGSQQHLFIAHFNQTGRSKKRLNRSIKCWGRKMTDLRKAAEMALKVLDNDYDANFDWRKAETAAKHLRQALAQPKQEPVAYWRNMAYAHLGAVRDKMPSEQVTAVQDWLLGVYTSRPQQPAQEQEPVAWRYRISPQFWTYSHQCPNKEFAGDAWDRWQVQPLYTSPPKREWVGLTDEDFPKHFIYEFDRGARWAEAKLKEKNT